MLLSESQLIKLVKSQKRSEVGHMLDYESRLKVMSEPLFFSELESEAGWSEIKRAIRNSVTQEKYNRGWLLAIGAGVDSLDPRYVDEWLFDWLDSGWLAEAAMEGFLDAPKMGTYHIENIVLKHKTIEIDDVHLL